MASTSSLPDFVTCVPLDKGGSGRLFFRVKLPDGTGAVLCRYDDSREENALYADIAEFLARLGLPVPRVLARDDTARELLLEDLGRIDLWSLRETGWSERRRAYHSVLAALHRLHHAGFTQWEKTPVPLMPGFDAALYRWEREYFLENAVQRHLRVTLAENETVALTTELEALAHRLLALPTQLVHRDCQSQNILWKNDTAWFIDFQGMRTGTGFYDLGSLLWDPYVKFNDAERAELVDFYWSLGVPNMTRTAFDQALRDAAAQRLMQALGAYGFLGIVKGRGDFLRHTTPALANLAAVTRENAQVPLLHALVCRLAEENA